MIEIGKIRWNCTINDVNENFASGIESVKGYIEGSGEIRFKCKNGNTVVFYHEQDCCECVWLEDADGLTNGVDIFTDCEWCVAEEVKSENGHPLSESEDDTSFTWTFYKFRTNKGYDFMRWYGESNGCYSEEVNIKIEKELKDGR